MPKIHAKIKGKISDGLALHEKGFNYRGSFFTEDIAIVVIYVVGRISQLVI
jgi:hypothetical protein